MTRAVPFTQASLRRAIEAARKSGLRVTGIRQDGTLIVDDRPGGEPNPQPALEKEREIVL